MATFGTHVLPDAPWTIAADTAVPTLISIVWCGSVVVILPGVVRGPGWEDARYRILTEEVSDRQSAFCVVHDGGNQRFARVRPGDLFLIMIVIEVVIVVRAMLRLSYASMMDS